MAEFILVQPGILQVALEHCEYYAHALDTFLRDIGASEENIDEFKLIFFPAVNCQGICRNNRLVGAAYIALSDGKSFIICQDMRHATDQCQETGPPS